MAGFVFYDGPSLIDGSPIIGIAVLKSENVKTGDMVQTFIIRSDMTPLDAKRTGADAAICGDCVHRPEIGSDGEYREGSCYVDVSKSVMSVFYAWLRGSYPMMTISQAARLLRGRVVRLGAYGDPAAIPARAWRGLISLADGHTGYSHQWRLPRFQSLRDIVMASADTGPERDVARAMGWRTFRVRSENEPLAAREVVCPASDEGGNRRQCITCKACDGASRGAGQASIAIVVHGRMAARFQAA